MAIFLKACLFLGVAAALIPSAFGLECAMCGPNQHLYEKKCEDGTVKEICGGLGGGQKYMCVTMNTGSGIKRECAIRLDTDTNLETECSADPPESKSCKCDAKDFCNAPKTGGGGGGEPSSGPTTKGPSPRPNGDKSGQQRSLKGPSFEILVMVLLGGVGLIWGQLLWG